MLRKYHKQEESSGGAQQNPQTLWKLLDFSVLTGMVSGHDVAVSGLTVTSAQQLIEGRT